MGQQVPSQCACLVLTNVQARMAIQTTPSPSYVPPVQWLPYRTRRISPTLASVLLQISGTGEQSQALLALTLEACVASLQAPMWQQRNSLRKRLAATAAVEGLVQLVGAEVAAAVTALGKCGRAQVAAVGPLPGVLAHVDDEGRPRCGHVFTHGAVAGIGARCHGNGGGTSHLHVAHLHLAHDFCGRKRIVPDGWQLNALRLDPRQEGRLKFRSIRTNLTGMGSGA